MSKESFKVGHRLVEIIKSLMSSGVTRCTRGELSPDAKGSGGHCGCERRGYETGVEG